jgi:membrane protease YdiL (CAAX protease family)
VSCVRSFLASHDVLLNLNFLRIIGQHQTQIPLFRLLNIGMFNHRIPRNPLLRRIIYKEIFATFYLWCELLTIDLFLWPMLLPLLIPLLYSFTYKKDSFKDVLLIILSMIIIVILYWPLTLAIVTPANIVVKFLLFVALPVTFLALLQRPTKSFSLTQFGLRKKGMRTSILLSVMFLPIMLLTTFLIQYFSGVAAHADLFLGIGSGIESFTEEFFFRGVLFLFLLKKTNLTIAYVISLASFVLMHPQNFTNLFLLTTIIQGILTIELCRRTENLTGAWILHGVNRFFTIALLPLIIGSSQIL